MEDRIYTYFNNGNINVRVQETEGYAFIHMDVIEWKKESYKLIKNGVNELFSLLQSEGYEWVFATSDLEQSVKFWNMMRPCHTVKKFGPNDRFWIGAWKLEE